MLGDPETGKKGNICKFLTIHSLHVNMFGIFQQMSTFQNVKIEILKCVWEQFPHVQKSRYGKQSEIGNIQVLGPHSYQHMLGDIYSPNSVYTVGVLAALIPSCQDLTKLVPPACGGAAAGHCPFSWLATRCPHSKDSTARIPQQGFHCRDSTAGIPHQGFHNRDSTAEIPWA